MWEKEDGRDVVEFCSELQLVEDSFRIAKLTTHTDGDGFLELQCVGGVLEIGGTLKMRL